MFEPGNVVLADRRFTIEEDVASCGEKLEIPGEKGNLPRNVLRIQSSSLQYVFMWRG